MKNWAYDLESGIQLREAIQSGDLLEVVNSISRCYDELLDAGIIDDYEYERYTEDLEMYDESSTEEDIDFELSELYDLCDNLRVWISL